MESVYCVGTTGFPTDAQAHAQNTNNQGKNTKNKYACKRLHIASHTFGAHNVMQFDYVLRVGLPTKECEQLDLANGGDGKPLLFIFHANALEGKLLGGIRFGACQKDLRWGMVCGGGMSSSQTCMTMPTTSIEHLGSNDTQPTITTHNRTPPAPQ